MVILEVGLGGRLDATNIVDADVAVVTSIALDHTDWLGPDRESIGREKAEMCIRDSNSAIQLSGWLWAPTSIRLPTIFLTI